MSGLMQAARVISSLVQTPPKDAWMLHLSCEGPTDTAAAALLAAARLDVQRVVAEVEPAIPLALRARPFSIRGLAGAGGERWVPVNGIVALDKAHGVAHALETWADAHASALAAANIGWSMLVSATPMQILFEPMFTWSDALAPVAAAALGERRERLPHHEPDPTTRALVKRYRADVRDLLDAHGAVHVGYGGYYGYGSALIETLRDALDPAGILSTHNLSRST